MIADDAAPMKRYRRLLALVGLSLLLHVLAISWIARRPGPAADAALEAPPAPLALRLQPLPPAPEAPAPAPLPPSEPKVADPAPAPEPEAALPAPSVAANPPPAPPAPPAPPPAATAPSDADAPVQMPSRYRSRMPRGATLAYTLTRTGQPPAAARMHWQTAGDAFTLQYDGVMGVLASQGATNDAGVAPQSASAQQTGGSVVATTFATGSITIGGRDYQNSVGSQDRGSLLLQLTGMGLSEPDQLRGVVEVYVAVAAGPEIEKFQVVEDETIPTPMGDIATRHLVQLVRAGEPRLEIWLAPERRWLPVQLRLSAPDGTVATQTVTAITDQAP